MWHIWGRGEVCMGFWWGGLNEIDQKGAVLIYFTAEG
jgi:hypothetical protein